MWILGIYEQINIQLILNNIKEWFRNMVFGNTVLYICKWKTCVCHKYVIMYTESHF